MSESETCWVEIPSEFLLTTKGDKIAAIADVVYIDFHNRFHEPTYLRSHAILSPTNEVVNEINSFVLARVPGHEVKYLSFDNISKSIDTSVDVDLLYPINYSIP